MQLGTVVPPPPRRVRLLLADFLAPQTCDALTGNIKPQRRRRGSKHQTTQFFWSRRIATEARELGSKMSEAPSIHCLGGAVTL